MSSITPFKINHKGLLIRKKQKKTIKDKDTQFSKLRTFLFWFTIEINVSLSILNFLSNVIDLQIIIIIIIIIFG
jgi:hypothetical protein